MKLILSRKGFDTANGGCPSPIFPDDTMFSLPIPLKHEDKFTYGELPRFGEINIGEVVAGLTRGRIGAKDHAHMSPDLQPPDGCPRLFDQAEAAERHLNNQGVGEGDIFLFFGLFRRVKEDERQWRFTGEPLHVLWGWLQVGARRDCGKGAEKLRCSCGNDNTRYVAREKLDMGDGIDAPGAGVFSRFDKRLLLTDPERNGVTHWRLPKIFHPHPPKTPLTYHGKRRWTLEGDYTYVQRNGPGQEFVLNLDEYSNAEYREAVGWARDLIRKFGTK